MKRCCLDLKLPYPCGLADDEILAKIEAIRPYRGKGVTHSASSGPAVPATARYGSQVGGPDSKRAAVVKDETSEPGFVVNFAFTICPAPIPFTDYLKYPRPALSGSRVQM